MINIDLETFNRIIYIDALEFLILTSIEDEYEKDEDIILSLDGYIFYMNKNSYSVLNYRKNGTETTWDSDWFYNRYGEITGEVVLNDMKDYKPVYTAFKDLKTAKLYIPMMDYLWYRVDSKCAKWFIRLNDIFDYACSDLEEITQDDFPVLNELFLKYDVEGLWAWCARKRGEMPINPRISETFMNAYHDCANRGINNA